MLAGERRLLDQRGRHGPVRRTSPASAPSCTTQPTGPTAVHVSTTTASGRSVAVPRRARCAAARGSARSSRPSRSLVAAPISPPTRPRAARARTRCRRRRDPRRLAAAADDREDEHQQPEREPDERRPPEPRERRRALGAVQLPARGEDQRAERDRQHDQRVAAARARDEHARSSTIAVSNVPTACRNASVTMPASRPNEPTIDASGVITAISRPAASTIAAETPAAIAAATMPAHREPLAQEAGELRRVPVDPPDPLAQEHAPRKAVGVGRSVGGGQRVSRAGGSTGRGESVGGRAGALSRGSAGPGTAGGGDGGGAFGPPADQPPALALGAGGGECSRGGADGPAGRRGTRPGAPRRTSRNARGR